MLEFCYWTWINSLPVTQPFRIYIQIQSSGTKGRLNKINNNMSLYQYRDTLFKDKAVSWPSFLIFKCKSPYPERSSLYRNGSQVKTNNTQQSANHLCIPLCEMYMFMCQLPMKMSSNGNIFRVTGHLCGEFTAPGEFPTQKPVTQSFGVFFDLHLSKRLSKQSWGWWFETLSRPSWRHRNALLQLW